MKRQITVNESSRQATTAVTELVFSPAELTVAAARNPKRMKIERLKANPLQATYVEPLDEPELRALADDMREHGQRQPIEILPDGTIIDGHQRVEAARRLGWAEIDAVIRHDLAEADEASKRSAFLSANLNRRHLHPLDRARLLKALLEAEYGRRPGGLRRQELPELAKRIRELMGMGVKNVERYLHVLSTPPIVQHLFKAGLLKLDSAARIGVLIEYGRLQEATQLAGELEGLTDRAEIRRVVERYLPSQHGRHCRTGDALSCFAKALSKGVADLGDRIDEVSPSLAKPYQDVLKRARAVIDALLKCAKKPVKELSLSDIVSRSSAND